MGVVYRARDTRLTRDVALKLLPASLAQDASRLQRFAQEARATSALNHPNILTVHDIGTSGEGGDAPFIVSELLEGADLRTRLADGPLDTDDAIGYAVQIAGALGAAHDKGIVHRDLKPENVFVTTDGRIKILDFGLAKLQPPDAAGADLATRGPVTDVGTVMGTVGYMSPEQVRGEDADHRSDIFSFGALLYELLTGQRAFASDTAAETMTAILRLEPPQVDRPGVPIAAALDRVVRRCLEKKRERRFQSAHDLAFALSTVKADPPSSMGPARVPAAAARLSVVGGGERLAWAAATALLTILAAVLAAVHVARPPAEVPRAVSAALVPPSNASLSSIAVSPDGRWLAFTAVTGGKVQLWIRALDSPDARPLAGTVGAQFPFWSPDSRFIGFGTGSKLKKIALGGGAAQTLCDAGVFYGGTWNRDGVIVFSMLGFGLYSVPASGGTPTLLIARDQSNYHSPSFLPDGRHFLYAMLGARQDVNGVYVGSLDGGVKERLLSAPSGATYAPPGYLLYVRDAALMAQPFDAVSRSFTGEAITIADKIAREPNFSRDQYSVSETGVLVYDPVPNRQSKQLVWVDRTGKAIGTSPAPGSFTTPSLSPDEMRAVVERVNLESDSRDIWVQDLVGGGTSRFTFDPGDDVNPVWLSDGSRIVWASNREGSYKLFSKAASGVGEEQRWSTSERLTIATSRSFDGRYVVSYELDPATKRDIWIRPLDGKQQPFAILQTPANEIGGPVSPDSRWLAYASDETGDYEIYVLSFPDVRGKWQLSTGGGIGPVWRQDGKELFYYSRDGQVMSVDVKVNADETFSASAPRALFPLRSGNGLTFVGPFAAAADGQRFLLNTIVDESSGAPLTLVIDWPGLLRR
jgi:Tol biopolymer transport system component